jgi:hypothetical protein
MARHSCRSWKWDKREGGRRNAMSVSHDGKCCQICRRQEWMVCCIILVHISQSINLYRLQTMQKMQQAAGGKGRGAGGMPTPAQIQAMQVSLLHWSCLYRNLNVDQRSMPPGMLQQMQRQLKGNNNGITRDDESHDARSRGRSVGCGGDAE